MLSRTQRLFGNRASHLNHMKRLFSVTQLSAKDDTFLLLQHQQKQIYLVADTHIPNKTATKIFETIQGVKPDTVLLQICQHRANIIQQLSTEYGDDLNEDICYSSALEDFANQYPMSSGIFSKSKTIIKPFELFGLLFSFADYKAIHAALLNQAHIIYADNKMKECIDKFEASINKMYDPKQCLNVDNMFEKDLNSAEIQRELAMGGSPREIQKRMMGKIMERMLKNRPKTDLETDRAEKKKKLYLNEQLEIDLERKSESGQKEIDWEMIYTRENGRILVNEVRESMKICVDALIDERNKNIADILMKCDGKNIVAFVNFANIDGIEEKWIHLS